MTGREIREKELEPTWTERITSEKPGLRGFAARVFGEFCFGLKMGKVVVVHGVDPENNAAGVVASYLARELAARGAGVKYIDGSAEERRRETPGRKYLDPKMSMEVQVYQGSGERGGVKRVRQSNLVCVSLPAGLDWGRHLDRVGRSLADRLVEVRQEMRGEKS